MTWTRLSDDFNDRPALLLLSRSARLLHVEGLVYSNRMLTDGRIPNAAIPRFSDTVSAEAEVAELVEAGLWSKASNGTAWQIQGWSDTDGEQQERAHDVQARKAGAAERSRRRRQCRAGDHDDCNPKYCKQAVTRDATGDVHHDDPWDVTGSVTTPRPGPSRPGPEGQGRDGAESQAPENKRPSRVTGEVRRDGRRYCAEHRKPIAADGERCDECAEQVRLSVVATDSAAETGS